MLNRCKPSFRSVRAWVICGALLTSLSIAGCGKSEPQEAHSDHDGHDHAAESTVAVAAAHSHEKPDETCFICDPAKREKGRLWCKEHGRYEDRCWLCHPELEDKDRLYCKEHGLYEDECFLCHPELKDANKSAPDAAAPAADAATNHGSKELFCKEHGVAESECGICHPDLAGALEPGQSLKVRFPSPESADKSGVRVGQPHPADAFPTVRTYCSSEYNLNTLARVTPLAAGVIRKVTHDVGDCVQRGDVLVELHSPQAASAKSEYLVARVELENRHQNLQREQRLIEQKIGARKDYLDAEAAHRTAEFAVNTTRQNLLNLGMTEAEIEAVVQSQDTSARLLVRAPFDGTLVERAAVAGEAVEVGESLFTIADLSTRWLKLSVSSRHISRVHVGQTVKARFDELPGVVIEGRITWVDTAVDPRSRMVQARAVVTEQTDRVKTGLFGDAEIILGEPSPAMLVPRDAVQRHENGTYVFVREQPDLFALRRVAIGASAGDTVEVLAGLSSNDPIVADGSFIVMSEFLKSRLGAGCTDH